MTSQKSVMKNLRRKNRFPIEKLSITSDRGNEREEKNICKENSPYPLPLFWA